MKHIVVIADPFEKQKAGIHRYTVGMINAIADYCPDIKISAIVVYETFPNKKVNTIKVPHFISLLKNDPVRKLFSIPSIINRLKPDVVIEPAHFGPVRIKKGIKRVTIIHDLVPVIKPQYSRFASSVLQRVFLPGILKNTDVIVTNSEFTKKSVINRYPFSLSKVHVAYPGIGQTERIENWDNKLISGVMPGKYFLHVGTIEPRKNIYLVLDAFELVKKMTGDNSLKLILAGETGWINKGFIRRLKQHPYHDSIILTGFIPDRAIKMLYAHALALVFPSFYEGFGFPIAEAMMNRCPVICSDIEVFHEVSGEHAFFCDPYSKEQLAEMMLKVFTKDFQPFVTENAYNNIQKFTWENYARRLSEILMH